MDHAKDDIIGSSSLDYLNAIGSLLANGAMETSVVIRMITLKDKRPAHEKGVTTLDYKRFVVYVRFILDFIFLFLSLYVRRMIERRYDEKDEQSNELNMIDVKFTQTKELEKKGTALNFSSHYAVQY